MLYMYAVLCALYTVLCALYTVLCALCLVHCALCTFFELCKIYCTNEVNSSPSLLPLFTQVGLGYLATRRGVWEDEVNWEQALSLGEQQRLAIARLVYHRPRIAVRLQVELPTL